MNVGAPSWRRARTLVAACCCIVAAVLLVGCAAGSDGGPAVTGQATDVGSTALQPLATAAAQFFNQHHPGADVQVSGGGSLAGLNAVTSQKADIGNSDVYADPATYPDPTLTDHLVCVVAFVMIVNPAIPVQSLKRDDIIKIFSTMV